MRTISRSIAWVLAAGMACAGASAADVATKAEAEALVKKATLFVKANSRDKAYAAFNDRHGAFVDRDLYLTVYSFEGVVLAHGANPRMIGRNLMEIKDVDGKAFVKERVALAKSHSAFWQTYKFTNPSSGKIEPKAMYCEPHEDLIICGGVYLAP